MSLALVPKNTCTLRSQVSQIDSSLFSLCVVPTIQSIGRL